MKKRPERSSQTYLKLLYSGESMSPYKKQKAMRINLIIVFLAVSVLAGCDLLVGTFTSNINGTPWEASTMLALKNGGQYNITGSKNTASIVITIPGLTVGTYNINPADTTLDALIYLPDYNNSDSSFISTQGVVDLTKVSAGRLTGTFNVWARSTKNINDSIPITGQFSNILSN